MPRSISSSSGPDQAPTTAKELETTADNATPADWRDVWEQVPPATLAVLLDAVDVCSLSDADTLDYLAATGRVTAWAQALKVRGMARFAEHRAEDGTGITGNEGYSRFAAGEIAPHIHQSKRSVSKELADAVQLWNWLPGTVAAMASGTIDLPRAAAIAHGARGLPDDLLPVYEANVLPGAGNILKESLQKRIRRVRNDLHPESLTVRHEREMEGRGVSFFPQEDGMAELYIRTSADKALLIYDLLQTHAKFLKTAEETRTLGQLRADVLADLLLETPGHAFRTATDTGAGTGTGGLSTGGLGGDGLGADGACGSCGRGPGPITIGGNITASVAVTIPLATAAGISTEPGHLAGYGPVPPETARNIAALAKSWLPVLIDENGEAVAVAKEMRHPPEWLKRLVRLRDESCRGPGCLVHSRHCDLDHTVAWEAGGKTELGNLAPYCKPDHIAKHEGGWRTTQEDKGVLRHQGKSGHAYISYPDGTWIRLGVQPPPEPPPDPFADPTPPPF
ncbi:HNH endonuclease signature motif containing protein [Arthrobacter mangrovi]|uniref:HNH endonuclease signature motif containing protein n=1 Tax=Arthrobacter mangrovi TaxID=2966350 RepID=UPI00222EEB75|nr:HNH endonuclease signature motif containing protein [Arthrobacter mangrovi]